MKQKLGKLLPYLGCIAIFLVISITYFSSAVFEDKVLFQADTQQGIAINQEKNIFLEQTGELTRWTNSLFGGMPTYQSAPSYAINPIIKAITNIYSLFLTSPASLIFIMMLGFFILLQTLRVRKDLSVVGAVMYAFSSYFFILIEAGHIWKFITLAYIPPTIAGILLAYRGKYLAGTALAALFAALQINGNHVQMTYYFLFVIVAMVVGIFIDKLKQKQLPQFFKASAMLALAAILAAGINISNLYHTYEYSKQTMRGGSELTKEGQQENKNGGLDHGYITQWSYGKAETLTLLIPNYVGGATGSLGQNETAAAEAKPQFKQYFAQFNQYWGDQPFTSGPVYIGAFVLFLAILSLFILKGSFVWSLWVVTVLTIMLSWGKNYMWLTELFIDYFPLYNKFRAVSSLLVVAEFTLPLLAILTLKKIIEQPTIIKEKINGVYVAIASTAGVTLVAALMPDLFSSFLSNQEASTYLKQASQQPQLMELLNNVIEGRKAIFSADAWRSFGIIATSLVALLLFTSGKIKANLMVIVIGIISLFDLWSVDKRYINDSSFAPAKKLENPFPMTAADREILKDKDPNYRVLNLTTSTFNDAATSYYHKSIGGYHAAKLQRYQDIIDYHLSQKMTPQVINMLNTKYVIQPDEKGQPQAVINPQAMGNAWFVDNINWVDTPNEEIEALYTFDPATTAIINKKFDKTINAQTNLQKDSLAQIKLVEYKPNEIRYQSNNSADGLAVFSEIYYPGWEATVDGKAVDIVQADYILRAIEVPAGQHEIVLTFKPQTVDTTETISYICFAIMLIIAALAILQASGVIACKSCNKGAKSKP